MSTRRIGLALAVLPAALLAARLGFAGAPAPPVQSFPLATPEGVRPLGVSLSAAEHLGRRGLYVRGAALPEGYRGDQIALLEGAAIKDGTIEAEIAGQPYAGAPEGSRGFVGIAFRVSPDASGLECFYLRPTSGRADDQLRRNHSTQYISYPGFPWEKLRENSPGVYESYVDLVPGEWTSVRIDVEGRKARLFANGASQPSLVVNDLKQGEGGGSVALWIGDGTEAWFRNVKITPR